MPEQQEPEAAAGGAEQSLGKAVKLESDIRIRKFVPAHGQPLKECLQMAFSEEQLRAACSEPDLDGAAATDTPTSEQQKLLLNKQGLLAMIRANLPPDVAMATPFGARRMSNREP